MTKRRHPIYVTDHAVVRYLERVENHDIDLVRAVIQDRVDRAATASRSIGLETYAVIAPEGIYQIVEGSVVTVLGPSHPVARRWHTFRSDGS